MNFTLILFLMAFSFTALWLFSKFWGKIGLYSFVIIGLFLSTILANGNCNINVFGYLVPVDFTFFVPVIFAIYLLLKRYSINDAIGATIIALSSSFIYQISIFTVNLYTGLFSFDQAIRSSIIPFFISILAFLFMFVVVLLFTRIPKQFEKFNKKFMNFLVICLALIVNNFIFLLLMGANSSVLILNIFIRFIVISLFQAIYLAILFLLESKCFVVKDNFGLEEKIKNTYNKMISKALEKDDNAEEEKIEEPTQKTEQILETQNLEHEIDEPKEIIIDDSNKDKDDK